MNLYPDECVPYKQLEVWMQSRNAAILNLENYNSEQDYVSGLETKARQNYHRAVRKGYKCTIGDYEYRNERLNEIKEINTSKYFRQGREMNPTYFSPYSFGPQIFCENHHFELILCLKEGKIVGYMEMYIVGEMARTSRVLGHADYQRDGIMALLFVVAFKVCKSYNCKAFCYSDWMDGTDGLRHFKSSLGFKSVYL